MSRTIEDFARRLTGEIPMLDILPARQLIQDALRDVYDAHQWSFLESVGVLYSPASITSGTFSVTSNSSTVVADATAITALSGLTLPTITKRQIRFLGSWPAFNIISFDQGTGIMVLDNLYRGDSNSSATYMVYRCFYGYPEDADGNEVSDFKGYKSITNPTVNYAFSDLSVSREWLDAYDPQRTNFDNPVWLVSYKSTSNQPQWEMYPQPTVSQAYVANYQSRFPSTISPSTTLPPALNEALVEERAKWYGYRWAEAHKGIYPELKGANWLALAGMIDNCQTDNPQGSYYRALEKAKNHDREMFLDMMVTTNAEIASQPVGDVNTWGYYNINYTTE